MESTWTPPGNNLLTAGTVAILTRELFLIAMNYSSNIPTSLYQELGRGKKKNEPSCSSSLFPWVCSVCVYMWTMNNANLSALRLLCML